MQHIVMVIYFIVLVFYNEIIVCIVTFWRFGITTYTLWVMANDFDNYNQQHFLNVLSGIGILKNRDVH